MYCGNNNVCKSNHLLYFVNLYRAVCQLQLSATRRKKRKNNYLKKIVHAKIKKEAKVKSLELISGDKLLELSSDSRKKVNLQSQLHLFISAINIRK